MVTKTEVELTGEDLNNILAAVIEKQTGKSVESFRFITGIECKDSSDYGDCKEIVKKVYITLV